MPSSSLPDGCGAAQEANMPDDSTPYSEEDWRAQLEEALALASILDDGFTIQHAPGHALVCGTGSDDSNDGPSSRSSSVEQHVVLPPPPPPLEEQLIALLEAPAPPPAPGLGLLQLEVLVDIQAPPDGVRLLLQLPENDDNDDSNNENDAPLPAAPGAGSHDGGNPQLVQFGPALQHLPPLQLMLALPRAYPSSAAAPPHVRVRARWLDAAAAARLEAEADKLWAQQGPAPLAYSLFEHLRDMAPALLGLQDGLVLPCAQAAERLGLQTEREQQQSAAPQLQGAQATCAAGEELALQLLRYDAAREADAFQAGSWLCGICFEQVSGAQCIRLPDCRHFYCTACLTADAESRLSSGAVDSMRCPEPSCRAALPPHVLQGLLGDEAFARWETLLLQRTLDRMEDVVYCPRCQVACVEDCDHLAQCERCLYAFCSICCDSWHPGTECLDPIERLRVLERRKQASAPGDRARQLDLVNQAMNLKYLAGASRACPSCRMATIKSQGCNKMTCSYCSANWCWRCSQVIPGYEHFRAGGCQMFDQAEIDRWHAQLLQADRAREVEAGQAMVAMRGGLQGARLCRCPVCGQENLREGRNNLLRCWSCSSHWCFACGEWLRGRVGQHFIGARACKQHG